MKLKKLALMASLAGLWAAAWTLLPYLLYLPLDEPMRSLAREIVLLPGYVLTKKLDMPLVPEPLAMAATAFLMTASAALLMLLLVRALDRKSLSTMAVLWTLRRLPSLLLWCAGWSVSIAAAFLLRHLLGDVGGFGFLLPAAFLLTMPFFCLRPEIIASDAPPPFWRPGWPGWAPVVFGVGVIAIGLLADVALSVATLGLATRVTIGLNLLLVLAGIAISGWVLLAWQRRSRWRDLAQDRRDVFTRQRLFPLMATSFLVSLVLSLLTAPVLVAALNNVFFLPEVELILQSHGREIPDYLSNYRRISSWLVNWWWLPTLAVAPWLITMAMARSLKLSSNQVGDGPAASSTKDALAP